MRFRLPCGTSAISLQLLWSSCSVCSFLIGCSPCSTGGDIRAVIQALSFLLMFHYAACVCSFRRMQVVDHVMYCRNHSCMSITSCTAGILLTSFCWHDSIGIWSEQAEHHVAAAKPPTICISKPLLWTWQQDGLSFLSMTSF